MGSERVFELLHSLFTVSAAVVCPMWHLSPLSLSGDIASWISRNRR